MREKIQNFVSEHPLLSGLLGLGVMFLFLLILFYPSTSSELSKKPSSSQETAKNNNENSNTPSPTESPTAPWVVGQNADYIISFPQDWKAVTRAVTDGGTSVSLESPNFSESEPFPIVDIEAIPASTTTPTQKAATLAPLNLPQTETTFKSDSAIQISGTLPFTPGSSNPNKSLIHKTYLIFQHGDTLYTIAYAEYEDKNQQANEQLMQSIINTIQFN